MTNRLAQAKRKNHKDRAEKKNCQNINDLTVKFINKLSFQRAWYNIEFIPDDKFAQNFGKEQ